MTRNPIQPYLAKQLVGDKDALTGHGRIIFCQDDEKNSTLLGGRMMGKIGAGVVFDQNWHMAEGTLIFVPYKIFDWSKQHSGKDAICGWQLQDFFENDGLQQHNWKVVKQ